MRTKLILAVAAGIGAIALAVHQRDRLRQMVLPLWTQTIPNVAYGPHPENRLDIMRPRWNTSVGRPAVIVFHGGSWVRGSKDDVRDGICRRYLQNGFVVANVQYRLGAIPATAEDAVASLTWFSRNVASYGGDPNRIVVTGESAGAHLALFAAFHSSVQTMAVVNFYGIADLSALIDQPFVREVLPPQDPQSAARAFSPITYARRGLPPVLSIHGSADRLVPPEQTAALTRAIQDAGGQASAVYIQGGVHGLTAGQQEIAYGAVFRFLSGIAANRVRKPQ